MFKKSLKGTKQVKKMSIFKKIKNFFKRLFCKKENSKPVTDKPSEPQIPQYDYELIKEDTYDSVDTSFWTIRKSGTSPWNKHAGLHPKPMETEKDGKFFRLICERTDSNEDGWATAAISTKDAFGDGKFECLARFKSGKSTWPAIWMIHPKGGENNYATYFEIDLSEYYETRDTTDTGYHCPQSMRGGDKYVKSVNTPIIKGDWNKFECEWNDERVRVWINGKIVLEFTNDGNADHYPVDSESRTFQIILSMQYTNRWLSEPDINELPLWMDIKGLKLYKKILDDK